MIYRFSSTGASASAIVYEVLTTKSPAEIAPLWSPCASAACQGVYLAESYSSTSSRGASAEEPQPQLRALHWPVADTYSQKERSDLLCLE
jgi:hypothetical protein